eukprot:TRINITY_DN5059_c0_g1_i3.p2 TRINITY_DN5059_c0_g1~~TRINITY_DN5059_c0_g1_i3.p2  ORF type:complete len:266 (+),score=45.54 TRINITY_DN5059_c0_g1_i3:32-829(+)
MFWIPIVQTAIICVFAQDALPGVFRGENGIFAAAAGKASSKTDLSSSIAEAFADVKSELKEIAKLQKVEERTRKAIVIAERVAEQVAVSVVAAFAETAVQVQGQGDNSRAQGMAEARAAEIASMASQAVRQALLDVGVDITGMELSNTENELRTALVESESQARVEGTGMALAENVALVRAVAEVVAKVTAQSFASVVGGQGEAASQVIAQAYQAEACPSYCNENPPPAGKGKEPHPCEKQKKWGKCSASFMTGYCECTCGSCVE